VPHPDDLAALKAERDAADRAYNEALTRLDRAIQALPGAFPHPPPGPDEQQVTPLNTLWKIDPPAAAGGLRGRVASAVRRMVAPLFEQQQAFNSAVVDHLNRNVPVGRETRQSIASTLTVLHDTIAELVRFQSVLVVYLQTITPYVDTRDRDVAGVIRGLSGAINAVADELMKRSEAAAVRAIRQDAAIAAIERDIAALRTRLDEVTQSFDAHRVDRA
jgi:hypothetical protein